MGTLKISYIWSSWCLLPGYSACFSAYLNTQCFKSWKAPCSYQDIIGICTDLCLSVQNRVALFQVFQCFVKNKVEHCCRQTISLPNPSTYDKRLLIFPSTITLTWAPSSVIFTSRSIFLGIPKLASDSSNFFFVHAVKSFF